MDVGSTNSLAAGGEPAAGDHIAHVHIGTMKSGSTYLQGTIRRLREPLRSAGVLVTDAFVPAALDVMGRRGAGRGARPSGAWEALVSEVHAWEGPSALLSMETLTLATPAQIDRIVETLAPWHLHVIVTARDLGRVVSSAWQQTTKNGQTATWPEYLESIANPDFAASRTTAHFWSHHDVPSIARQWADRVGTDNVTIVTVPAPPAPKDMLWARFAAAAGLDGAAYPAHPDQLANESLGFAEAEVLRRLNVELGASLDPVSYRNLVTRFLSRKTLRRGVESTAPPALPAEFFTWVVERSDRVVRELDELGVRIEGDLGDLIPVAPAADSIGQVATEPPAADVAAAATRVAAAVLRKFAEAEAGTGTAGDIAAPRRRGRRRRRGDAAGRDGP